MTAWEFHVTIQKHGVSFGRIHTNKSKGIIKPSLFFQLSFTVLPYLEISGPAI